MQVTVLDPEPRFGFLPNIHELVSGVKRPRDLELDRAALMARAYHEFVPEALVEVDRRQRVAHTSGGRALPYDQLVLAVGGQDRFHGVDGAEAHALPFKSVAQCVAIRERLRQLFARTTTRSGAPAEVSLVIVGAGLEGVECLGEILRRYHRRASFEVHLVDSSKRLLPGTAEALHAHLQDHCKRLPVSLHLGTRVARVDPAAVTLSDGTQLPSGATIWTGGLGPPAVLHRLGLATSSTRWGAVDETLRSRVDPRIWMVGDAAELPSRLSKQAYYAQQMGSQLAANLMRVIRGRSPRPLRPRPKPMLISFGALDTFLVLQRAVLAGPSLAALKEGVFQVGMAQLQGAVRGQGLAAMGRRIGQAAQELLLPQVGSLASLRRLPGVRVLRD
jgi:NADH dehydrogenase